MNRFALEPIEKASVDELRALQLKRLQATLRHAYQNSPVYRPLRRSASTSMSKCPSTNGITHTRTSTSTII